ncbi:hypothetical protein [Rhodospirillum centenum]|uniref:Uncharacterized protein n=1 Tax=Rhodospirillum centenum (strain ATCC 51521 / SW) TaxID=414684 RepID=B6IYB1_RHOCS|nr:hypothetical protein [Rhodospirillum centenum]ACJ01285.1 hypothetical protein RC1_3943 [Rhodospirillum centenum SW]
MPAPTDRPTAVLARQTARTPADRLTLGLLPLLGALLFLTGCAIEVNGETDEWRDGAYRPRSATDICRREVYRSYDDDYRIAFELPEMRTEAAKQTVTQTFTLTPKRGRDGQETRTIRCTVTDGALTDVATVR